MYNRTLRGHLFNTERIEETSAVSSPKHSDLQNIKPLTTKYRVDLPIAHREIQMGTQRYRLAAFETQINCCYHTLLTSSLMLHDSL